MPPCEGLVLSITTSEHVKESHKSKHSLCPLSVCHTWLSVASQFGAISGLLIMTCVGWDLFKQHFDVCLRERWSQRASFHKTTTPASKKICKKPPGRSCPCSVSQHPPSLHCGVRRCKEGNRSHLEAQCWWPRTGVVLVQHIHAVSFSMCLWCRWKPATNKVLLWGTKYHSKVLPWCTTTWYYHEVLR